MGRKAFWLELASSPNVDLVAGHKRIGLGDSDRAGTRPRGLGGLVMFAGTDARLRKGRQAMIGWWRKTGTSALARLDSYVFTTRPMRPMQTKERNENAAKR